MADVYKSAPLSPGDLQRVKLMLTYWTALVDGPPSAATAQRLLVPDSSSCLQPGSMVFYNDAAWLVHRGVPLVHSEIDIDLAKALGVRSLRDHHAVGGSDVDENVACPADTEVRQAIHSMGAGPGAILFDIVELAHVLGSAQWGGQDNILDVWLDSRTHPAQQLLKPEFAQFCGPAVCVRMGGTLGSDELVGLLLPPSPFQLKGATCTYG